MKAIDCVKDHSVPTSLLDTHEYIFDSDKIEVDKVFSLSLESYPPTITVDYSSSTNNLSDYGRFCRNLSTFYRKHVVVMKTLLFIAYYLVGVIYYSNAEGWNVVQCIYFITETVACIGTGYFYPLSKTDKLFTMPYLVFGATLIIYLATDLVRNVLKDAQNDLIMFLFYSYHPRSKRLTKGLLSRYHIALTGVGVALTLLLATLFFHGNEGWSFFDSFYYSLCIMTTVGYGMYI